MFTRFFYALREAQVPVSVTEYLTLLEAVKAGLAAWSVDSFYYLSRAALVKDERYLDRFDKVFGHVFQGLEALDELFGKELPEEWLDPAFQEKAYHERESRMTGSEKEVSNETEAWRLLFI